MADQATIQALQKKAEVLETQADTLRDWARALKKAVAQLSRGRPVDLAELDRMVPDGTSPAPVKAEPVNANELAKRVAIYIKEHNLLPVPVAPSIDQTVVKPEELAKKILTSEDLDQITDEVGKTLKERFIPTSGSSSPAIDAEEVARMVLAKVKTDVLGSSELRRQIKKALGELDLEEFLDQVYEDVSSETLHEVLAKQLAERVFKDVDPSEVAQTIADAWLEDNSVDDTTVAEKVADRITISYQKP